MAASLLALLSGCGATGELRAIGEAHRQSVTAAAPVVLFLPGTLASKLENSETGEVVWGGHDRLSVDPRTESGLRQLSLALTPVPSDTAAAPDAIRATDLLRRAATRILGIRFSTPIYDDALAGLAAAGLTESAPLTLPADGPALVPFPYDWRRSIVDGALDLGRALEARGEDAPKVTLLAHSMGATVALYYLMFGATPLDTDAPLPEVTWAGASKISRAILVAPPLRGSAVAIRNTVNGNRLAGPLVPVYPPSMLATHPSTFELMPREGSVSIHDGAGTPLPGAHLDPGFWAAQGWGLLGDERAQDRAWLARGADDPEALAAARQADLMARGRAFHRAFDRPVTPPEGLDLVVLAGKGRETPGAVSITGDGGVSVTHHVDGDEVVAYESATAGLDAGQPNIRIFPVDAVHSRMLSDPEVFELVMRLLAE